MLSKTTYKAYYNKYRMHVLAVPSVPKLSGLHTLHSSGHSDFTGCEIMHLYGLLHSPFKIENMISKHLISQLVITSSTYGLKDYH